MNCSMPGFLALHYLLELAQTHVHWVGDAIQPSHLLSSSSLPALNLSQNRGLFQWVSYLQSGGQSIGASASASVLPMNIQGWFPLVSIGLISLLAVKGTLKSLLQHHGLKASILWWSAFFMVLDAQIHPPRIAPFYRCVHLSSRRLSLHHSTHHINLWGIRQAAHLTEVSHISCSIVLIYFLFHVYSLPFGCIWNKAIPQINKIHHLHWWWDLK